MARLMASLEVTEFKLVKKGIQIRFMNEFIVDETLTFYIDGGFLRCRNKHMSREFV